MKNAAVKSDPNGQESPKRRITRKRMEIVSIKSDITPMGVETEPVIPEDIETMFAGKTANILLKSRVAVDNIMWANIRSYINMPEEDYKKIRLGRAPEANLRKWILENTPKDQAQVVLKVFDALISLREKYVSGFDDFKKEVTKTCESHPLWKRLKGIKGFTPYQLGLIMALVKDIERFNNPSQLLVYAGVSSLGGMAITKGNINKIKEYYFNKREFETVKADRLRIDDEIVIHSGDPVKFATVKEVDKTTGAVKLKINTNFEETDDHGEMTVPFNKEFTRLKIFCGFNTTLSGRLFVVVDCLLRARGFFFNFYDNMRKRLEEKAKNEGKAQLVKDRYYMVGRKNQSLEAWSNSNARRRVARTLLMLIYIEWRTQKNLPVRDLYVSEHLGHTTIIKLDEVIAYDASIRVTNKKKGDDAGDALGDDE